MSDAYEMLRRCRRRQIAEAGLSLQTSEAIRAIKAKGLRLFAGLLPAVGESTPPVRLLNPDGSLREVVTAQEFRQRQRWVWRNPRAKNPGSPWRELVPAGRDGDGK